MTKTVSLSLLVGGIFVGLIVLPVIGTAESAPRGREKISDLAAGKKVVVQLHKGLGNKVKGAFVRSDARGITLRTKDEKQTTIPWDKIRRVKTKRTWHAVWIGMATGAALAGVTLMADSGDGGGAWAAAWVATGATSGAILSEPLDPSQSTLYEAPKEEDPDQ